MSKEEYNLEHPFSQFPLRPPRNCSSIKNSMCSFYYASPEWGSYVRETHRITKKYLLWRKKRTHTHTKKNEYWYMLTFTYSTKKHSSIPPKFHEDILALTKAKRFKWVHFAYALEHHEDGRPHYHAAVCTKGPLCKDRFSTFYKRYGDNAVRVDRSSRTNTSPLKSITKYITKESPIITIINGGE